jgi:hypothetical protein
MLEVSGGSFGGPADSFGGPPDSFGGPPDIMDQDGVEISIKKICIILVQRYMNLAMIQLLALPLYHDDV